MTDEPNEDNGDYLGYGVYAETLWARVISAIDRDQQGARHLGDDPLVVGIFGEWGAGKSTLLKLIELHARERAQERAAWRKHDGGNFSLTVPVFFQPWKYEHEPHLHVPILLHILAALKQHMEQARTPTEWAQGKVPEVVKRHMDLVVGTFGLLLAGAALAMDTTVPLSSRVALAGAGFLAKVLPKLNPDASNEELAKTLEYKENGRFFYEMHETLQAITRPRRYAKHLTGVDLSTEVSINFVIFIDDLDRCLPEKAVETLELIKTVFNLESFAFVLALDEEVVERGIGHRYKDYALQNKKPEMPITGFEYLEKIVHLPFRLPGLTKHQARRFLERYESEEVAPRQPERWWFAPQPAVEDEKQSRLEEAPMRVSERNEAANVDLSMLVLSAFTTYVPRKLVRLVELLHQVQEIALRRGKKLTGGGDPGADVRVMTALVMIQLFQPDLYRLVRRKPQALPLLLAAFAKRGSGYQDFSDPDISDVDLWLWVVEESAGKGNDWIQTCSISEAMNAVVRRISTNYHVVTNHGLPVQYEVHNEDGEEVTVTEFDTVKTRQRRSISQNVKLPLVAHIVEHRAAQRHAFDPLRLMHALAGALETGWAGKDGFDVSPAASLKVDPYFSLMVPLVDPHWELYHGSAESSTAGDGRGSTRAFPDVTLTGSGSTQVSVSSSGRMVVTQPVRFPDRLLADLVSEQTEVQANLVANNELEVGKVMEMDAAKHLLSQLQGWVATYARETEDRQNVLRNQLARGLRVIAPFVPHELGRDYLALVDDLQIVPFYELGKPDAFDDVQHIGREVARAELWSALGQDDRFDPDRFYLPRSRWKSNSPKEEPLEGFVQVVGDGSLDLQEFKPFSGELIRIDPFAIARYLTTVDQFECFVDEGGYGDPDKTRPVWWSELGWEWRTGRLDGGVKNPRLRSWLSKRLPGEPRSRPPSWGEQLMHGGRPVVVHIFEAAAYGGWLTTRLQAKGLLSPGLLLRLPTEVEWERTARALRSGHFDDRVYPWGGSDDTDVHLRANIKDSRLGEPCITGLFAPNPLGIFDLCGNVMEWKSLPGNSEAITRNALYDQSLELSKPSLMQIALPPLSGGSFNSSSSFSNLRIGSGYPPGTGLDDFVGFRLVLSEDQSATRP